MNKMLLALVSLVFAITGCVNVEAQVYQFNSCPPGSVLVYRRVPSPYGVSTVAQCQYVAGYPYYGAGVSYYYGRRSNYYRTPYYRTPYYNRTPFYNRTPYYNRGPGRY